MMMLKTWPKKWRLQHKCHHCLWRRFESGSVDPKLQPQPHMRKQHPSLHCPRMWNFNMPLQLKVVTLTSLAHAFYHHYSQQNAHKRSGCNRVNSTYAPSSQLVSLMGKYTSITTILDNGANKHLIMVEF